MTPLFVLLAACQNDPPTASELISRMIAHYYEAKTISGTIDTTIQIGVEKATITSVLVLERPTRLFIGQTTSVAPKARFLLTSDGKEFSYNRPVQTSQDVVGSGARLIEPVTEETTLGDIYRAAGLSLAERSVPIDLAIADVRDLRLFKEQLVTLGEPVEVPGTEPKQYRIEGDWRLTALEPVTAQYRITCNEKGDLLEYELAQGAEQAGAVVRRIWKVDFKVDEPVEKKAFTVVR
ncbi:MAG: hypothetical protein KIT11_01000 [Fimbriimonadaceae bacterium]|nr:hypothetical protein [Fimbriimonadaceae bacterium]QYK55049.1 MAG: hypothetical protein KF733_08535 [Fimbriimonadaceae bacterium]